jgi:hypothetical protein
MRIFRPTDCLSCGNEPFLHLLTTRRPDYPVTFIMSSMTGKVCCAALGSLLGVLMPCVSAAQTFALDSTNGLHPHDVKIEAVTYRGRKAVRVMPAVSADAELAAAKND